MKTKHIILNKNANNMVNIGEEDINLVVTSPPYPMVEMWDNIFSLMNPIIKDRLYNNDGDGAFELMHQELDKVWKELYRVVAPGGIVCINVGDATRSLGKDFKIFMNSSRIVTSMVALGFSALPQIIWRKPTNSPNKFMGSGMLPGGAYVTLEHEHILLFRKHSKREFKGEAQQQRGESAYFWEERNKWFSDMWDIKGERQQASADNSRTRTAAYPLEIPLRLINMYSKYGDTVLDPFMGTGTTNYAAMILGRSSVGYDIDLTFVQTLVERTSNLKNSSYNYYKDRMDTHNIFVQGRETKYVATYLQTPVVTSQEKNIKFYTIDSVQVGTSTNKIGDKYIEILVKHKELGNAHSN